MKTRLMTRPLTTILRNFFETSAEILQEMKKNYSATVADEFMVLRSIEDNYDNQPKAMCAVVVSQTSCNDRNHPILRGVIVPHQDFFFFAKIMILLDF